VSTITATEASPRRRGLSQGQFGLLLALPAMLLFTGIVLYPLVAALIESVYHQSLVTPGRSWAGLSNFRAVLQGDFVTTLEHTLVFTVCTTALAFLLGLGLALALNTDLRARGFLRGILLFPWVLPSVVVSFLWLWIFNDNYGLLNGILVRLHLIHDTIPWLGQANTAMLGIIVAKAWASFPWIMVMLLAGMQTIPAEMYEAAEIDGAGRWRRFRSVTLPRLRPVIATVVLLEGIWNFQHFDTIYVLTGGGPAGTTTTFSVAVYDTAFKAYDLGRAGALGVLWMAFLSVFVVIYLRVMDRNADE
jgi:multiple sugar transport system permease protein